LCSGMVKLMFVAMVTGLNIVFRKLAGAARPVVEIAVEAETVRIISHVTFYNQVIEFKLGEEFTQEFEGMKMTVRIHVT
jgi:hypothetical protein